MGLVAKPGGGSPTFLRMDVGTEMTSDAIADWCKFSPTGIVLIDPGSPWQHPFVAQFHTLLEAKIMAEDYRQDYNQHHPHSSLGYLTPNKFIPDWNHH
ncbi:MAG: integrase core domain-containing protein [Actinomycetota bacterium]|nr:integrase core domain-containing protein [Actinomycetota bacterium]